MIRQKKRIAALAACIILLSAMAFSELFLIVERHHNCTGDHCAICQEMQACAALINSVSFPGAPTEDVLLFWRFLLRTSPCLSIFVVFGTLVSLKVKLTD